MKLFLDTNVVMDLMAYRTPFVYGALRIFQLGSNDTYQLFASDLTFANVAYLLRKLMTLDELYSKLSILRTYLQVADIGEKAVDEALRLRHKGFEDALQCAAARQTQSDCIITRNKKDFTISDIPVWTPEKFLPTIE